MPGPPRPHWPHPPLPRPPRWWGSPQSGRLQGACAASVLSPGVPFGAWCREAGGWTAGGGCGGRTAGGLQGGGRLAAGGHGSPLSWPASSAPPPGPPAPSWLHPGSQSTPAPRSLRLPEPPHIQSLPPRSFGPAPPLLGTRLPAGSPQTAPRPGCGEVHPRPAQGSLASQGPGSLAPAVEKKGR